MDTIVSRTLSVHQEHELLLKLEAAGLDSVIANRIIHAKDNDLALKLVRLAANGGFEPTTSQKRARELMSRNFFGIEEAIQHFGVNPSRQQLAALADIPFTEVVLEECKDTHVLVALFPLSILEIRGKVTDRRLFYNQDWYNKQAFAKERGETEWRLVRKMPVPNSTSKTWPEQQALLAKCEETPTARVVIYTMIGHFLATGERLFENIYVRCLDVASGGRRVYVGFFRADGLCVASARTATCTASSVSPLPGSPTEPRLLEGLSLLTPLSLRRVFLAPEAQFSCTYRVKTPGFQPEA